MFWLLVTIRIYDYTIQLSRVLCSGYTPVKQCSTSSPNNKLHRQTPCLLYRHLRLHVFLFCSPEEIQSVDLSSPEFVLSPG